MDLRQGDRTPVIVAALRTPIARARKGALARLRPDDLLAELVRTLVARTGVDAALIEDVVVGCAMPEGEQGLNLARQVATLADLPVSTAGTTVNRFCGSSLEAANNAAAKIACGAAEAVIAAGVESMSLVPMGGLHPERAINPRLFEKGKGKPPAFLMPQTAQYLAEKLELSRADQDAYALRSHQRAVASDDAEAFADERVSVAATDAGGKSVALDRDECIRRDTSLGRLAQLTPIVGPMTPGAMPTITAGNSCPTNDGAAALLLMSATLAARLDLTPLAVIRAFAVAGVEPHEMGIGPAHALAKLAQRDGLALADAAAVEINEAFAAVVLANLKLLGLPFDAPQVNPLGGAIALGHPLGASGARLLATLAHHLRRRSLRAGVASMCIGGGMGIATWIENPAA